MIEIRSEWNMTIDDKGRAFPVFAMFMTRDGNPFNCVVEASNCFKDGEMALMTINTMIESLVNACYPEIRDPIYRMKKELEALDDRKKHLIKSIAEMEEYRNEVPN